MSTQRESRRSVNPILHIWASKLSFLILLLKLRWVGFTSHFMVLYFRNVDLDLPKISELYWTPVLSRYGDENLTSWKNRLVHLWPTSFIRANYVQLPSKIFYRTPLPEWPCSLSRTGWFSRSSAERGKGGKFRAFSETETSCISFLRNLCDKLVWGWLLRLLLRPGHQWQKLPVRLQVSEFSFRYFMAN